MAFPDWLVIGLGNPGRRYLFTRHNIGFLALDFAATELSFAFDQTKYQAQIANENWSDKRILWMKPQTFMNLSGQSLNQLLMKNQDQRENIGNKLIVVHDEIEIPFGRIKVKWGGGDAGHNGLKSLRSALGHGEFFRIRMGVGKPVQGSNDDLADYVLRNFEKKDEIKLGQMLLRCVEIIHSLAWHGLGPAQELAARPLES